MKRRAALTSIGMFGFVGLSVNTTFANAFNINYNQLAIYSEFTPGMLKLHESFVNKLSFNFSSLGLDESFIAEMVIPTEILESSPHVNNTSLTFKNSAGNVVTLGMKNGIETFSVSN